MALRLTDPNSPESKEFFRKCKENESILKGWLNHFGISKEQWCHFHTVDNLLEITAPIISKAKSSKSKTRIKEMIDAEENLVDAFPGWHDPDD